MAFMPEDLAQQWLSPMICCTWDCLVVLLFVLLFVLFLEWPHIDMDMPAMASVRLAGAICLLSKLFCMAFSSPFQSQVLLVL